jgi:protein tyrosine/serine phosphatase
VSIRLQPTHRALALLTAALIVCGTPFSCASKSGKKDPERPANWAVPIDGRPGLPNLHRVSDVLYRGAQPRPDGYDSLHGMGIHTVVNLRAGHHEGDRCHDSGLGYVEIPMRAWKFEEEDVVRFLQVVQQADRQPIFVHCRRGADRAGMIVAVYRVVVQGWSKDEAIDEMKNGGYGFNSVWSNLVDYVREMNVEELRAAAAGAGLGDNNKEVGTR